MNYFRKFTSRLSEFQRNYLDGYLRRKRVSGDIGSDEELNRLLESISISDDGEPLTVINEVQPNSVMDSASHNSMLDSLSIDLGALFAQSNATSYTIGKHEGMSKAWVGDITRAMNTIDNKIAEFKKLAGNTGGYTGVHSENFSELTGARFLSTIIDNGSLIISHDSVDTYSRNIQRVTTTPYPAENHAAGVFLAAPAEFNVANDYRLRARLTDRRGTRRMLRPGTRYPGYWVSIMLTDRDIRTIIDGVTYHGYVNLLRIFFSGSRELNEIEIDPVGKYRTYIQRVRYRSPGVYSSDGSGWNDVTVINDDGDTIAIGGSSYGKMIFKFTPITASAIEIMFNAMDYDLIRYKFAPEVIRNALLWDELTDMEYDYLIGRHKSGGLVDGDEESSAATSYLDRTVVNIGNTSTLSDMVEVTKSSLNIDKSVLDNIGLTGAAILKDTIAATALGDHPVEINKSEYVIGAYSVSPQRSLYSPSGVFYSHVDGGYDTYERTVREVILEATQHIPALTSIEYYLMTDSGVEIPVVPLGISTYRERLKDAVDAGGNVTTSITFQPVGDVSLYMWESGASTLVTTATPVGQQVSFAGLSSGVVYVMEYALDTSVGSHIVTLSDVIPSGTWLHTEVVPDGHRIQLPTSPYIDYSMYNWYPNMWNYASGVAGYYSDPNVLMQDVTSSMWTFTPYPDASVGNTTGVSLVSVDKDSMLISGWFASGWHHIGYTGTGGEFGEYTYTWETYIPSSGWTGITINDSALQGSPSGHTNRYEPIELFIDGAKAEDRTNYKSDTQQPLDDYSMSNKYQFYLFNDSLYTNVNFGELPHKRISVKYRYLTSHIRLKAVMYTNIDELSYYTPSIDSYQLRFMGE